MRARMSAAPPGGKGTTILISRPVCARATRPVDGRRLKGMHATASAKATAHRPARQWTLILPSQVAIDRYGSRIVCEHPDILGVATGIGAPRIPALHGTGAFARM